ncbi:MAG: hypothetical protein ABEN55_09825 [Bradymonadaceae bacterium]
MDLADTRGRQRLLVEVGEQLRDVTIQMLLDLAFDRLVVHRRDLVLELLELVDKPRRQDVRARRQDLAQFDERRPQILEDVAESDGDVRLLVLFFG